MDGFDRRCYHGSWQKNEHGTGGPGVSDEEIRTTKQESEVEEIKIQRPPRAKLTAEESLKRMEDFPKRRDKFIASVRKGKS
jgi:hypothetical protein